MTFADGAEFAREARAVAGFVVGKMDARYRRRACPAQARLDIDALRGAHFPISDARVAQHRERWLREFDVVLAAKELQVVLGCAVIERMTAAEFGRHSRP